MPYVSDAQRRYFNANRDELEAEGVDVDEWNQASEGKDLPERAKKKRKKKAAHQLFPFLPYLVGQAQHHDTILKMGAAWGQFHAALATVQGLEPAAADQPAGQAGQARQDSEKLAGIDASAAPTVLNGMQAPIAPTDGSSAITNAEQTLRGFMHPETQYQGTQMYGGAQEVPSQSLGGQYALGYPIDRGKLGNGPGVGGINGMGGLAAEKAAMAKYAALADFNCGDLTIKDREDLGLDFHNRMANDKKLMFLTQGGELGLLDYLQKKYPDGRLSNNVLRGHRKAASLNVSAVGEGDYSKLRVCPFNSYGQDALDEMESRMHPQAKKSPTSSFKADVRDKDEASSEKCSQDQDWLHKLAKSIAVGTAARSHVPKSEFAYKGKAPKGESKKKAKGKYPMPDAQHAAAAKGFAAMHHGKGSAEYKRVASKAKSLGYGEKQGNWLADLAGKAETGMQGWDPTAKAGVGGAVAGGLAGTALGGLGALGGPEREPINTATAQAMVQAGIGPQIIWKLMNPASGDLTEEEIKELAALGFNYNDVAPKPSYAGHLLTNALGGGALGAGLGGLAGAGIQEGSRFLTGELATQEAGARGKAAVPDWMGEGAKDTAGRAGRAIGGGAWNALNRNEQFDVTRQGVPFALPDRMVDNTLKQIKSWR